MMAPSIFSVQEAPDVDSSKYLRPNTDRIFEFKTKRIFFKRRISHMKKMVCVIYFEGIVGEITKRNLSEDGYFLLLRKDAVKGLKELA